MWRELVKSLWEVVKSNKGLPSVSFVFSETRFARFYMVYADRLFLVLFSPCISPLCASHGRLSTYETVNRAIRAYRYTQTISRMDSAWHFAEAAFTLSQTKSLVKRKNCSNKHSVLALIWARPPGDPSQPATTCRQIKAVFMQFNHFL